jgi:hypothetical protein
MPEIRAASKDYSEDLRYFTTQPPRFNSPKRFDDHGGSHSWGSVDEQMTECTQFDASIAADLRRRVTGGLIVAVLLTVFLGFWSWRSARREEQDAYWLSHTYEGGNKRTKDSP